MERVAAQRWARSGGCATVAAVRLGALSLLFVLALSGRVRAGNGDAVPVANDAAMMGQAAVANGTGAAALYYNPALLGRLTQARADVSASAFHLRLSRSDDLIETPRQSFGLRTSEVVTIPSAVAYARPFGDDWRLGFGVFSPSAQDLEFLREASDAAAGIDGSLSLALREERSTYVAVISAARRLGPGLWLGASLQGLYGNRRQSAFQVASLTTPRESRIEAAGQVFNLNSGSLAAQLGLTWEVSPRATLAATVTSPVATVATRGSVSTVVGIGGGSATAGMTEFATVDEGIPRTRFALTSGAIVRAGAEVRATPRLRLAVDAEVHSRVTNQDLAIESRAFWNARLGLEGQVSENVWLAGGVFTDRQGAREVAGFAITRADFWGLTAGVRWQSRYRLAAGAEHEAVTFGSVVAVRYAYAAGSLGGLGANVQAEQLEDVLTLRSAELQQHELGLHLGAYTAF